MQRCLRWPGLVALSKLGGSSSYTMLVSPMKTRQSGRMSAWCLWRCRAVVQAMPILQSYLAPAWCGGCKNCGFLSFLTPKPLLQATCRLTSNGASAPLRAEAFSRIWISAWPHTRQNFWAGLPSPLLMTWASLAADQTAVDCEAFQHPVLPARKADTKRPCTYSSGGKAPEGQSLGTS